MMDRTTLVAYLLATIVLLVGASAAVLLRELQLRELDARVAKAVFGDRQAAPLGGLLSWLYGLGDRLRRFYSQESVEHLGGVIRAAGFNQYKVLPAVLGVKMLLMVLTPALALALAFLLVDKSAYKIVVVAIGVVAGVVGPELILGFVRRRFVTDLQRGTPDALDLLVVCSESGMGFESALERVANEMHHSNRAMSTVLAGLLDDLRVLPDRREAFTNLGKRTGVEGLKRLGTMLNQSLQYGTPLGNALRAVAEELRRERMNRLEERTTKLPAKLIFPLILFILPCLWIILLGSSVLHLTDMLSVVSQHHQ